MTTRTAGDATPTMPAGEEALPAVSVLVPMRNEEATIASCLESVLAADYPAPLEVLVIDGMSEDRSRQAVARVAADNPALRLIENPRRNQAAALNLGLAEATGDVVVRADAHTTYAPDYVRRCVEVLRLTGAWNAGGPQRPVGEGYLGEAIALATGSRFAAGDAAFRDPRREGWVDTVYLGAWRRETLERLGGFDEEAPPNEDDELNLRIRGAGGGVYLSPSIRSEYRVRGSLRGLAAQYFRYGRARVRTLRVHPGSLRLRQLAAPALVAAVAVAAVSARAAPRAWTALAGGYALADAAASVAAAGRGGWRFAPALPMLFPVIHLSWGVGFWAGIVRHGVPGLVRATPSPAVGGVVYPHRP